MSINNTPPPADDLIEDSLAPLLAAAVEAARHGLEVLPLRPDKAPLVGGGMKSATSNLDIVRGWWYDRWPAALIGVRVPAGFVVIDVDPHGGGEAVLAGLEAELGPLPDTRTSYSGRGDGGRHLWFRLPGDADERLGDLPPGVDVLQHHHRYSILPPSPHPATGAPYRWAPGSGIDSRIADLPMAWFERLRRPQPTPERVEAASTPSVARSGDGPIGRYSAEHSISELLSAAGWALVSGDGDGDGSAWRHPAATNAHSASVSGGRLYVYSPNAGLPVTETSDPHGLDVWDLHVYLDHHGDVEAALAAERALHPSVDLGPWATGVEGPTEGPESDEEPRNSWLPLPFDALSGEMEQSPMASIARTDGVPLLYQNAVQSWVGEPESGKTIASRLAIKAELEAGGRVVLYDFEDYIEQFARHVHDLGFTPQLLTSDRVAYAAVNDPLDATAIKIIEAVMADLRPTLIVIDGVGEAFSLLGLKMVDNDDTVKFLDLLPRRLLKLAPGAAILMIDHVTKSRDSRGRWALGAQAKLSGIDAQLNFEVQNPLVPGRAGGRVRVTVAKDRRGQLRSHAVKGHLATFRVDPADGTWANAVFARFEPPDDPGADSGRPVALMEAISLRVEDIPGASKRQALDGVRGGREAKDKALDLLIEEGYLRIDPRGRAHCLWSEAPFRADDGAGESLI